MKKINLIIGILLLLIFAFLKNTEAKIKSEKQKNDTIEGWKNGGIISLSLSQASLTNWSAGGQNSISLNGYLNLFYNYKKENTSWENYFEMGYGFFKQGKEKLIKTDDKINITSKYGKKAFKKFYYSGLLNFRTQMAKGYNYPNDSVIISNIFAPAYLLGAIGLDYKPNETFSAFLAPLSLKTTFVNEQKLADAGAFGVKKAKYDGLGNLVTHGKKVKTEIGAYFKILLKKELMKNVSFQTNLELFSNYAHNPQNIDIIWDVLLAMKINNYLTTNITTNLIYDDDIDIVTDENPMGEPQTQFKELLGIGFTYNF